MASSICPDFLGFVARFGLCNDLIIPPCRPSSSSFDSVMRSRYFPGGPTPDGLDSDIIFKSLAGEEMRERARRESEGEMMTDNR